MTRSEFEKNLSDALLNFNSAKVSLDLFSNLISKRNMSLVVTNIESNRYELDKLRDFLIKYDDFFALIQNKFGIEIVEYSRSIKIIITDLVSDFNQIKLLLSQREYYRIKDIYAQIMKKIDKIDDNIHGIISLPEKIDYSRLTVKDWKNVGKAGVHYKSRIFLSYPFRNSNPRKDQNEQFIIYIKQLLNLLGIQTVTARDYLRPQDLIDDRIVELVESCDGIIGFYTKGDKVSNVEHELSQNENIIAVCRESGVEAPSMRLSRLLIDFNRDEIGDLLLDLIKVLREKKLFRLVIS